MPSVRLSAKFQVVIPPEVRKQLALEPGQTREVLVRDGTIELVPVQKPSALRGFVRGIDTSALRDRDRV